MATTRFKNTSNATWTTLKTIDTEWKFDIYGVTPKILEGMFEQFECEMLSGIYPGDIDTTLEELTCVMSGYSGDQDDRTGDIDASLQNLTCEIHAGEDLDCTLEYFTLEMVGTVHQLLTGDIDATLENFTYVSVGDFWINKLGPTFEYLTFEAITTYTLIDAQLEYFQMEGYMANGISASLEPLTIEAWSLYGASISGTLQNFTISLTGETNYVAFEPKLKRITAAMYSGAHIGAELSNLQADIQAIMVSHGELDAVLRRLQLSSSSGAYIRATLPKYTLDIAGTTPVKVELVLETRKLQCTILATTETVESLLGTLRRMSLRMGGTQENPADIDLLEATLKKLQANITGISGQTAYLEGDLRKFAADFTATMESIDGFDATLEEFTLTMRAYSSEYIGGVLFDPSEDCEPFETLEFGVV